MSPSQGPGLWGSLCPRLQRGFGSRGDPSASPQPPLSQVWVSTWGHPPGLVPLEPPGEGCTWGSLRRGLWHFVLPVCSVGPREDGGQSSLWNTLVRDSDPVPSPSASSGSCSTRSASTWISSLPVRAVCLLVFSFDFNFVFVFPLPSITISPLQLSLFLPSSSWPHLALGFTDNPAVSTPARFLATAARSSLGSPGRGYQRWLQPRTRGSAVPSSDGGFGWSRARICSRGSLSCSCFLLPRSSCDLVLPWASPEGFVAKAGEAPSLRRRLRCRAFH